MSSPESEFDDVPLPVNLHFPDERVLTVDIDGIMRSGRRIRRNRRVFAGAVAAAAISVLGVTAAYLAPVSSSHAPVVGAAPSAGSVQQTPDKLGMMLTGGGRVTVIGSRANPMAGYTLSAVAWRAGPQICYGTADTSANTSAMNSTITCANRPSALSASTPTVLAPNLITGVTDALGARVAIGFVSGDVAKVSLKAWGTEYDATVVAVPGSPAIGAYVVWIGGADAGPTGQEFTQITGYNSQGAVVTGSGS